MKYFIIAGEPSGDLHGSHLVRAIRSVDPDATFRGWGGDLMRAAGAEILTHYRELAFMGIIRVITNLPTILRNEKRCRADIESYAPDRLILIDYSGFNLRIARWAGPLDYDISYYISPQVWAWRSGRVKHIRKHVDRMLSILPFEKAWYAERGVNVHFVGHPLIDVVDESLEEASAPARSGAKLIALLPGSRKQEIESCLPVMLAAAEEFPDCEFVIAAAPNQDTSLYEQHLLPARSANSNTRAPERRMNVSLSFEGTHTVLQRAHGAIVTSGTATLETALFGVPQVVVYRGNPLEYRVVKAFVGRRIRFISLVNLIMDEEIVPELIQGEFTRRNTVGALRSILTGEARERQLKNLNALRQRLGSGGAATRAARLIVAGD